MTPMHARLWVVWAVLLAATHGVVATTVTGPALRPAAEIEALIAAAPEGGLVEVPAGAYAGPLRIDRPVILEGRERVTIDGGGTGTVVEIHAANVTFRGFTVRGSGSSVDQEPAGIRAETGPVVIEGNRVEDALFGIDLRTSSNSIVRGNRVVGKLLEPGRRGDGIRLWWSNECVIADNLVLDSRDMVFWYSESLQIRGNHVRRSRYGLHFMYSHDTVLSHNTLEDNSVGVYLMYSNRITVAENTLRRNRGPSGYGLGLKDCDDILVQRNAIEANRVGLYVDNAPSSMTAIGTIAGNLIAFNELGMLITPNTRRNTISGNGFVENEEQVAVHGRGELSGNAFAGPAHGNYWSDYAGFDRDRDRIGDLPYEARNLFESLLAREPSLRLFIHSPAQRAIEFTSRALPEMRPEPKFIDPRPLMSPPLVQGAAVDGNRATPPAMLAASAGLLSSAALLLALSCRSPRHSLASRRTTGAPA